MSIERWTDDQVTPRSGRAVDHPQRDRLGVTDGEIAWGVPTSTPMIG
jgi:hypothetical protein